MAVPNEKTPTVVLELRPAFDGYAGIPQETRLLFRGLRLLNSVQVSGMLQMSGRILAKGTWEHGLFRSDRLSEARKINRYSRVVISAAETPFTTLLDRLLEALGRRLVSTRLTLRAIFGVQGLKLSTFRSNYFEDFIWRALFAKTLAASDFKLVTSASFRVCHTPWKAMHAVGLNTLSLFKSARYARVSTRGVDIFISQTPYPARLSHGTQLVVRYHDALPVFMPHTIPEKSWHQASHFYSLANNVKSGAYFACVSDATRKDLLTLFPEVAERAVTIHNIVSHHYYLDPASSRECVRGIIRSRLQDAQTGLLPKFLTLREQERFYEKALADRPLKYLLAVSTIEPRKNHARLLAAWEILKGTTDPNVKLVLVGTLGWDNASLLQNLRPWIDRGEVFMLNAVPAPDLRVLYRHAAATVCPSLGEGFDFSGAEAMRSGGVVIASDIPVHREVYDGAAVYFDPYSTASLLESLKRVIFSPDATEIQGELRARGQEVAARYLPEKILPQWERFLAHVLLERSTKIPQRPAQLATKSASAAPSERD